jgi:hypothetical protein
VTQPLEFFRQVLAQFDVAASQSECSEHFFDLAGHTIQLRFAGSAVMPLIVPALEHLRIAPVPQAELTVCLWDVASTGVNLPQRPWGNDVVISRGEIRGFEDPRILTSYRLGQNVLSMLDTERDLGVVVSNSAAHIPKFFGNLLPMHDLLHWWVGAQGLQFVHAAAVGKPDGGVLLPGKSGSGKSTTALTCLQSDLLFASDDYCIVEQEPRPYVHSLYSSAQLVPEQSRKFPHLASVVSNREYVDPQPAGSQHAVEEDQEYLPLKHIVYLHEAYPGKVTKGFPVKAIFVPRITGQPHTKITPAKPMDAFKALTPSSVFQLSGAGEQAFRTISKFVRSVPTCRLELGTNLDEIPLVISRYLSDH